MKRFSIAILTIFCLFVLLSPPQITAAPGTELDSQTFQQSEAFQQSVERVRKAGERVGVMLVSLPSGQTAFEYQSNQTFVPASLVKLLTSFAALKKLGPSFRFGTDILARSEPVGGIVQGDIWIRGSGDPFFVSAKAPELAQVLKDRGIRQITGGIFTDETFFSPRSEHICLDADCIGTYNPVVSATAVDFNQAPIRLLIPQKPGNAVSVDPLWAGNYFRVSGKAVSAKKGGKLSLKTFGATGDGQEDIQISGRAPSKGLRSHDYRFHAADPAGLFAHTIRAALDRAGIRVLGRAGREDTAPPGAVTIARYESPPLSELAGVLNKYSNNFMAEMLLKGLSGHVWGPPGTTAGGVAVVRTALKEAGVPDQAPMIDCGSGLSRFCTVSPETFCRLLVAAWQDPAMGAAFISSLAVNAEEGTLRRRMRKPGLTVRGKTGTLKDVVGFAGFISGPSGKTYAVAIMLNGVRETWKARQAVDAFIEEVAFSMRDR